MDGSSNFCTARISPNDALLAFLPTLGRNRKMYSHRQAGEEIDGVNFSIKKFRELLLGKKWAKKDLAAKIVDQSESRTKNSVVWGHAHD